VTRRAPRGRLAPAALVDAVARHRVLLSAGLAAAAVASSLSVVAPGAEPVSVVVAAAHDLPAGTELTAGDLTVLRLPAGAVPAGALRGSDEAAGRLLAGPVRRGEPLTDVRLLGAGLVPAGDHVAVPVRVADPAVGHLLQAGDRVDVLAAAMDGGTPARTVVGDVAVLAVPDLPDDLGEGALVVVAATSGAAARLASAAVTSRLSLAVRGR
jgi:Flp pilus assembly protein CpaB